MVSEQAQLNRIWARTLLEELTRHGVAHLCVAPGSRSTPLTLEADANPKIRLHPHFDERGLGFLALGIAKASGQPVAVVVTSGTAVANLLPAVVEAGLTGEKLVLLTADRPAELIDCGANQAIVQSGIFSGHVTASLDLPSPSASVSLNWLLTSVDTLMAAQLRDGGAIHFNCPFPEPLYLDESPDESALTRPVLSQWRQRTTPYSQTWMPDGTVVLPPDLPQLAEKNVLIIAGDLTATEAQAVAVLAEKLGCPLLCDPQSGISSQWAHFDLWLQDLTLAASLNDCEFVLQFGARLVSKRLNQWLAEHISHGRCEHWLVTAESRRQNPAHLPQRHWVSGIANWAESAMSLLPEPASHRREWAEGLKSGCQRVEMLMDDYLTNTSALSEIALAIDLSQRGQQAGLFLGNSLIVRLADGFTRLEGRSVYTNRGASGIDGLVATAAGVQRATGQPLLLMLGDTALLHDLNSLALMRQCTAPVVIVVTNNDGGAIFDLLPVPDAARQHLYQMPHGLAFAHAASQFGVAYHNPVTLPDYQSKVSEHFQTGQGALLLEVKTPAGEAAAHLRALKERLYAV
ncbi:2-succinyl-5-enolpyruvyl-6-hydroxy-3-cyclohexene-1-carboxylic-acid synthase [Photobacterium sp. 1_MG-2023]|uniref:2-succinyl-5-enolpyruvyl-6-hydroxy-3- cyclohexene-1-carboxylic-acid synthase n=1 Tax=Photobacterium sp. 1_MG-2023 TaxID=3062646 RepID=UPI0026E17847|nr:2-succinyl-5-enolpyruvyl-6-hydroxy-3-cyclohexene-1-carboxylic-acid synthase [Photobacterium sp. 1_MG-2023]MDO6707195.1 2-succinyl-5-enolpyruvyl-6-hydroxy-3-cyclohexene-1-carboxylic-acid synthase [Photobacterium sp. 1_MG-2023]